MKEPTKRPLPRPTIAVPMSPPPSNQDQEAEKSRAQPANLQPPNLQPPVMQPPMLPPEEKLGTGSATDAGIGEQLAVAPSGGLSTGAILGIVFGVVAVIVLTPVLVCSGLFSTLISAQKQARQEAAIQRNEEARRDAELRMIEAETRRRESEARLAQQRKDRIEKAEVLREQLTLTSQSVRELEIIRDGVRVSHCQVAQDAAGRPAIQFDVHNDQSLPVQSIGLVATPAVVQGSPLTSTALNLPLNDLKQGESKTVLWPVPAEEWNQHISKRNFLEVQFNLSEVVSAGKTVFDTASLRRTCDEFATLNNEYGSVGQSWPTSHFYVERKMATLTIRKAFTIQQPLATDDTAPTDPPMSSAGGGNNDNAAANDDPIPIPGLNDPPLNNPNPAGQADEILPWSDVAGKHLVDAAFVSVLGSEVVLRQRDGTEVRIPLSKLLPQHTRRAIRLEQDRRRG